MKHYLYLICLLIMLVSGCSQEEMLKNQSAPCDGRIFTASFDQNMSRTYVEESNLLRWTAGDKISLFDGNALNRQYKFDGETGDNAGTFSIVSKPYGTGNDLAANYAVYPYSSGMKITESGVITATLPAEQSYAENSFGLGANTMVAVTQDTDDTFLKFKNVGGYLKIQLYGNDVTVKSITLTGNNNEKLAGKATITPIYGQDPTISMADDATNSITLDCGEGIEIGATAATATAFWIVVPPTTFESGFTIKVVNIDGEEFIKSTSKPIAIERNVIKPMSSIMVNMDALLLPDGSTFNSIVGTYSLNNTSVKKLRFIANSQVTSETLLCTDADGTVGYLTTNGEWLEIHTPANSFKANKNCSYMFGYDYYSDYTFFADITDIDLGGCFNTSNVENMSYMFSECTNLSSLNLNGFNTTSVNDMSYMFYYCSSLTSLDVSEFNTSNVTNMAHMFNGCSTLSSLDVSKFNTSNVTDMSSMFERCSTLSSLDVSNFNTSNVTNMNSMFYECAILSTLDVSKFNTSNVTDMGYMFLNCSALTSLDISKFDTSNVTDMIRMFYNCSALTSLDVSNFNTAKTNRLHGLFYGCSNLSAIDVSHFNTTNVGDMSHMFSGCSKLKVIDVSGFNTTNVSGMGGMFNNCSSLSSLDLLNFTFEEYPDVSNMLNLIGSTAESNPIPVKVTKEGYIYLTQITTSCKINTTYARFVNEDGSDCDYEEDVRVYNSSTTAIQPELVDNVYLIQSAANLKWFMENCEKGSNGSAHYKLTTDIISYNISWDPVWFSGIFDGGNHSIANLKFYGYEDCAYGFFAYMSGTVKNLVLINPTISQTGDNDSYGMQSGLLAAEASGLIINCGIIGGSVSVSSTSKAWVNGGGMVGNLESGALMKGCYVIGTTIKGDHWRNGTYIGGLIGESYSGHKTITSCYTKDIIISGNNGCNIGTFIGHTKSSSISITTCYYDSHTDAIGNSYNPENIMMSTFQALTDANFTQAITQMNANLTDCDYIFGEDGLFIRRQ